MNAFKTWKLKNKDVEDAYNAGRNAGFEEGVRTAIKVNLYQVIQFLGDKRGWRRESIFDALKWLNKHADMMLEDLTTFDEVMEVVRDEYGIIYKDGTFYMLPCEVRDVS